VMSGASVRCALFARVDCTRYLPGATVIVVSPPSEPEAKGQISELLSPRRPPASSAPT
jgi:hypothetical protein